MKINKSLTKIAVLVSSFMFATIVSSSAAAHCDSGISAVIKDVQAAIANQKIDRVLTWVGRDDEATVRDALKMTLAVREESEI
ncbi:hypothetical protein GCM10010919_33720 [Alishewanella longhuensis]|uniref:Uncharacterized protein n=1 Tax=Alishewanella longhuensis TaxID=1091037 RepID=A0ABQ3LB49_9ALTE|nr:DUF6448 family protein [Alishewanella longhuensis]GHG77804.1 hypothetical protein GCM10010919_33720 [Alishewanella longhuensis]